MKRIKILAAVGLLLVLCLLAGRAVGQKRENDLMRRKLAASQQVLEGIAVGDFKKISENADELLQISKEAGWRVLKTPAYEVNSNEFRRSAEMLRKQAEDKNLDGAALTYVEMTLTCVRCHKHVREVRMTRAD